MKRLFLASLVCLMATLGAAQAQMFELGADVYEGGQTVTLSEDGKDDVFLSGLRVRIAQAIAGNAYLAGRFVDVDAAVGNSLNAVGQNVRVAAPVAQDAILAGQRVQIDAEILGDARVMASEVDIRAPIGDTLLIFGEVVLLNAPVAGDAAVSALDISFGPDARIAGRLVLYEDSPGTLEIPERVIPESRIERRNFDGLTLILEGVAQPKPKKQKKPKAQSSNLPVTYLWTMAVLFVLGAGLVLLARNLMDDLRDQALERWIPVFGWGCVTVSTMIGGSVLVGVTVVGLVLVPVIAVVLVLALVFGLLVGGYSLGSRLYAVRGHRPDRPVPRVVAVALGTAVLTVLGLVPLFGNLALLGFALWGIGALVAHVLRPRLLVD